MSKQTAGEILKFDVLFTSVSYMSVYFIKSAVNTLSFQVLKKKFVKLISLKKIQGSLILIYYYLALRKWTEKENIPRRVCAL